MTVRGGTGMQTGQQPERAAELFLSHPGCMQSAHARQNAYGRKRAVQVGNKQPLGAGIKPRAITE
jgi:hypothetical protein